MAIKNQKVFITGGSGFIGSYLIERLFESNEITCYDRVTRSSNVNYLLHCYGDPLQGRLSLIEGDVKSEEALKDAIVRASPDIIFHLASLAGVRQVMEKPFETMEVNVIGSHNLLTAIRETGLRTRKIVFASTSEVYGPTTFGAREDAFTTLGSPHNPRWSYSASKAFVEHTFIALEQELDLPVAIARPFNIYGPRQIGEGAIHAFVDGALHGRPLTVYGKGDQIRAWCYVDDCIDGLLLVAEKGDGIYNVGNPQQALATLMLAQKIKGMTSSKSDIVFVGESKYTDVCVRVPSIERIEALGYKPRIDLDDGLQRTIDWYRSMDRRASSSS